MQAILTAVMSYKHACAGLRIKENKEVYEGEVTELTPEETENQMGGYGRVISHVVIGLKTVKGSKQLRLDPTIYDSLQKERVNAGDVIYIEASSGMTGKPMLVHAASERQHHRACLVDCMPEIGMPVQSVVHCMARYGFPTWHVAMLVLKLLQRAVHHKLDR